LNFKSDPGQLHNIYPTSSTQPDVTILSIPVSKVLPRLDALLMVTKSCKGHTCVHPWSVIHPAGNVQTLEDALNTRFDSFYSSVSAAVSFDKCELGYILESEGPQEAVVFHEGAGGNWQGNEKL
jgi:N-acetylglucosamine-6-sulfatase